MLQVRAVGHSMMKRLEIDVGRAVRAWLLLDGWEVHSEVVYGRGGGLRADIVARLGKVLWVVECKTTLGFAVVSQAMRWERVANMVSVAVPTSRAVHSEAARRCLPVLGVGLLAVYAYGERGGVRQEVRPAIRRRVSTSLEEYLCEATRAHDSPGEQHGDYHTPFRGTCRAITDVLAKTPGLTTKELVAEIDHHYASDSTARSALVQWMRRGVIPGVSADGKPLRWHLDSKA
jgi:hypothetical protein